MSSACDNMTDEECEEAIKRFAEMTQVDEGLAHFLLQESDFDINRALTEFFNNSNQTLPTSSNSKEVDVEVVTGVNGPQTNNKRAYKDEEVFPSELTLISWNVDGLDDRQREKRFTAALYIIAKTNPEVIFLQEMVEPLMPQLNGLMSPMYSTFIQKPNCGYFCIILVSKNIKIIKDEFIPFDNTKMGRGMLIVEGIWQNLKINLLNSHLESTADYSNARSSQFAKCLEQIELMTKTDETLAIFGGDLNIRDKEVGNLPESIKDVWIEAGSQPQYRYTWDLKRNDNYAGRFGKGQPRARFDRILFKGPPQTKVDFKLEGINRIKGPNCFVSDHFALICRFLIKNPENVALANDLIISKKSKQSDETDEK
uniref:Endonuclease/exonuclease/phosphatase domain-containing protein n=1 Tax=Meloidogyne incognita TaxID=6306 RepID=A0A914NAA0_MELIC